ncbi:MAG: cobalamin biosynthesis protein [Thermoprotei archaeon]|nr:MAG: cobalamin biosynthesis protein [Thermoprotei archaeon]
MACFTRTYRRSYHIRCSKLYCKESTTLADRVKFLISKRAFFLIIVLVLVSPVFGVILADMVGYHEPLDLAAEALGLEDKNEEINWTPFIDYTVPGLPDPIGYVLAGFMGVVMVLALGMGMAKILSREK